MTTEEKAKAYDEALEKAKKLYGKYCINNVLESLFPELAESEDELTWLTRFIEEEAYSLSMDVRDNEDRIKLKNLQSSLAWLKKQDKPKLAESENEKIRRDIISYIQVANQIIPQFQKDNWIAWLEKQGEWSEEEAKTLNRISTILVDASEVKNWWKEYRLIERDEMIRLTNFLKSLRPLRSTQ